MRSTLHGRRSDRRQARVLDNLSNRDAVTWMILLRGGACYWGEVWLARADGCVSAERRTRRRPCTGGSFPGAGLMAKKRGPFQTVPVMARAIADRLGKGVPPPNNPSGAPVR